VSATVITPPGESFGVALNGDVVNGRVAWPGQTINGCKVGYAIAGPRSINSAGQIALNRLCTNGGGYDEIVRAAPG
jgi:hypothetical protein